jgi:hypothetical protein
MNYQALAQILGAQGRYGDTELVHVTPREKRMLRESGGSGTINPFTGLDEYFEGGMMDAPSGMADADPGGLGAATDSATDVGAGGYATGPNVGTGMVSDIGPEQEVGTHPFGTELDVAPAVAIENTSAPTGIGGIFGSFMSELGRIGPSLSRDGPAAIPALGLQAMIPGASIARGGMALANTVANALGIPSGPAPIDGYDLAGAPGRAGGLAATGSYGAGQMGSDLSEALPQYMGMNTPPSTSMAIPNANTTPASQTYKGLEPYMRDLLRRQGIFI